MPDRRASRNGFSPSGGNIINLNQGKGRAWHIKVRRKLAAPHASLANKAARQNRLARPKVAAQRDDIAGLCKLTEPSAKIHHGDLIDNLNDTGLRRCRQTDTLFEIL